MCTRPASSHLVILVVILALAFASIPQPAVGQVAVSDGPVFLPIVTNENIPIPPIESGKFNVAFVYVGPIGESGWTYGHNEGRIYLEEQLSATVHTAYLENVPEGAAAERVIRKLAQTGFDAVFTTSFGYMDATETVAGEFPDVYFVHVSGFKRNSTNFANLLGAMESMNYLAGMIAGARAQADSSDRVGYIATFPIPESIRRLNATALGMRRTCPECLMDIRWIYTWFDPEKERQAADSLLDAGAAVVITSLDTDGPIQTAGARGRWGIGYDSSNACDTVSEHCLTVPYWNWGAIFVSLVQSMTGGTFVGDNIYFDVDSGALGLLGFMDGQTPAIGVTQDAIPLVQQTLASMRSGETDRFTIFTGPINDNKGNPVVAAGASLTQSDLEGIQGITGRPDCTICMNWLAEGIVPEAELPR